jgi:hypothetical protein
LIFFTSDQHYGHAAVIRYASRPFADVAEMNEALVARFNDRVSPEDETFHLGDFSLDDRLVRDYLPRLNGRHHLIAGNHDACFPKHRKWRNAADRYHRHWSVLNFRDALRIVRARVDSPAWTTMFRSTNCARPSSISTGYQRPTSRPSRWTSASRARSSGRAP